MFNFNYKNLSDVELQAIFRDCRFKTVLTRSQKMAIAFTMGEKLKDVAYWIPVRGGKTKTALLTAQLWGCKKILVVCPNDAFGAWEHFIPEATDYSFQFLIGTKMDRIFQLRHLEEKNIYIINYEGLKCIYANQRGGNTGYEWEIDNNSFIDNFDCLILDEGHKCNDRKAIQANICYELAHRAQHRIALSADPVNKHYLELFNIYRCIDLGKSLGHNFFQFRNRYFKCWKRQGRNTGRKWEEWVIKKEKEQQLLEAISHNSISFERSEVSDVPDNEPIEIEIDPSNEFLDLRTKIIDNDSITIDNKVIDCSTTSSKGQKLLQLSGGFAYCGRDHNDENGVYKLTNNPKLDKLIELINQLDAKIIVWHRFIEEAHIIEAMLTNYDINYLSIRGGTDTKNLKKKDIISKFAKENIKVLLVQCAACQGWNGVAAKYMIFYTPVASPRLRNQCEGRIKGDGQVDDYKIYDLILKQSFDQKALKNLKTNKSFSQGVMEYIRGLNK